MLSKKKLTDIFLRKDDRPSNQNQLSIPFDQNYFELHSQFNGTNLSLISVSATILKGEKSKQKLNLKCKWFIKTSDDFREIQQITGSYYQPCLDDIGNIISVQIEPFMEDRQYQGITIIKEFGPIKLDSKLEQFQSVISKSKMFNSNLKLQSITSEDPKYSDAQLPIQGTLILNQQCLQFLAMSSSFFKYQFKEYEIITQSVRKAPNSLYLRINEQFYRLTAESTLKRDQLIIAIKRFSSKTPVTKLQPQSQLNNLLKIDQLTKNNALIRKQLQQTKIQHQYAIKSKTLLQQQSIILKQRLKQHDSLIESVNLLKAQNNKAINQNSYYINQISIYKKLDKQKQIVIQKLQNDILEMKKQLQTSQNQKQKIKQSYQQSMSLLKEQMIVFQKQDIKQKQERNQFEKKLEESQETITRLSNKYNSLVSDRSIIDQKKSKKQSQQKELEIQALKSQIFNLESLINKHKAQQKETRRLWDIKQLISGLKNLKGNNEGTIYLQKLVANLTETVTEKELQLTTQKQSNKIINQQLIKYKKKFGSIDQQKEGSS